MPRDCSAIYESGERFDGVYTVYIGDTQRPVKVYCDMGTDGGRWTVCITAFQYANVIYRHTLWTLQITTGITTAYGLRPNHDKVHAKIIEIVHCSVGFVFYGIALLSLFVYII